MSSNSHESLSAAYASAYDYLDQSSNTPAPPPYHNQATRHESRSTHSSTSGLPAVAPSTASSSTSSYYTAQQPHHSHHPQQSQQQQHKVPQRYASAGAYDHASYAQPLRSNTAAQLPSDPNANMYGQSNISMPALQSSAASRNPPLADDVTDSFANMNFRTTPQFGPQRVMSPGLVPQRTRSPAPPSRSQGSSASVRANAAYANQEIHRSAAEVQPENSLAAIADQVEQAADGLDPSIATPLSVGANGSHHLAGASSRQPEWSPQLGPHAVQGLGPTAYAASQYGSGMRQHSAPGEYAAPFGDGQTQLGWDPNYYPNGPTNPNYAPSTYSGFQNAVNGGYSFTPQQQAFGNGPEANAYFAAASGFLGFPEGVAPGFPPGSAGAEVYPGSGMMPAGVRPGMATRQGTGMSAMSVNNTLSGMSSVNSRRKSKDATPQQTLPFNKSFVAEYRQRMKGDPDAEAQFAYAKYLIEAAKKVQDPGDGPKQQRKYRDTLLSESLKLIKRLATTGMGLGKPPYSEAQFFLANCFGNGSLGLQVDHEKAYNLYVQASKQNHPAATYRTAVCNEVGAGTRRDHHRAVLFYRKASALGDTAGMYKLGMVLLNGLLGQPRNVREAIVWLKRAASQADEDNPHALHELGLLHEKPTNGVVLHDEAYARELFTQAAQLGYSPSQFKLGSAYEYGNFTCPVDPRRSIAWYTKAAGKGDGESELALSGWYLTGSEGVLKQSDSEAYLWARRAASKGIPKAEYAVGYYSEVGIGVEANLDEAKRWYMRAAAQGNKRSMQRLTELKKLKASGLSSKKSARPTRKDAESECIVM